MRFVRTPNDEYIVAKRVAIVLEKFKDILQPTTGESPEPIAVYQNIDKKAEYRVFLAHGLTGMRFDTLNGALGKVSFVNKRDIIAYVELQPGEIVVDRLEMTPIVDPEGEWVSSYTHGTGN